MNKMKYNNRILTKKAYTILIILCMPFLLKITFYYNYCSVRSISKASAKLKFGKRVIDENLENNTSGHLVVDLTQDSTAYVRTKENIDAYNEAAGKTTVGDATSASEKTEEQETVKLPPVG